MATHNVYGSQVANLTQTVEEDPINVGGAFYVASGVAGWTIDGGRFYMPSMAGLPTTGYVMSFYKGNDIRTAGMITSVNAGTVVQGWNNVTLPEPIAAESYVGPESYYWVVVHLPGSGYSSVPQITMDNQVVSPTTSGVGAPNNFEVAPGNGVFAYGPQGSVDFDMWNGSWYGVDIIVNDNGNPVGGGGGGGEVIIGELPDPNWEPWPTPGFSNMTASGNAKDVLDAIGFDGKAQSLQGSTLRTVRRSMWEDRVSLSSMQFQENTLGPVFKAAGAENEVGVEFTLDIPGRIVGSRIYKHPDAEGEIRVSVWDGENRHRMASKTVTWSVDEGGWREVYFDMAYRVDANRPVVVSYYTPTGHWAENEWVYNQFEYIEYPFRAQPVDGGVSPNNIRGAGRLAHAGTSPHAFPTLHTADNYHVDPIAEWEDEFISGENQMDYFDQFPNAGFSHGFPIAVYYSDPQYVEDYMSIGVNTMWSIPINTPEYRTAILNSEVDVWASNWGEAAGTFVTDPALAERIKGYAIWDEPDMVHNPGTPAQIKARAALVRTEDSTRPINVNFGKWPAQSISYQWWPPGADAQTASANWLGIAEACDVISCDWYNIALPASQGGNRLGIWTYPMQIQKMRSISNGRVPVFGFVETCPVEESVPTPEQVARASWSMIIAGAKGIIYFDHHFTEPFNPNDFAWSLHDPVMRAGLIELNAEIQSIADPLMYGTDWELVTPPVSANTTAGPRGGTFGVPIHHRGITHGGYHYLLAQAIRPGSTDGTFTAPTTSGKSITVLGEGRTITANAQGVFVDQFTDDYEYHLYRWAV